MNNGTVEAHWFTSPGESDFWNLKIRNQLRLEGYVQILNNLYDSDNSMGTNGQVLTNVIIDQYGNNRVKWMDAPTPDLSAKADLVNGLVPTSQLPSFVDDVLEFSNFASFPVTGDAGKLYLDLSFDEIYRWSGSTYIKMSSANPAIPSLQDVVNVGYTADLINIRDLSISGNLTMGTSRFRDRFGNTGDPNQVLHSNGNSVEWKDLPDISQDLYKKLEFTSIATTTLDIGFAQEPRLIFINSALLVSADWSFSGTTVTFAFAPDFGAKIQII
jgi:hypothetical protein